MIVFPAVRGPRVFEMVLEHVRGAILAGQLKTGDRLPPERELVRQFRVGRSAIREALRILEQSGLLRMKRGKGGGAFVRQQVPEAFGRTFADLLHFGDIGIEDISEVRLGLEGLIIDTVVDKASDADFARLRDSIELTARYFAEGRIAERDRESLRFHVLLAEATRNPLYPVIIGSITDIARSVIGKTGSSDMGTQHALAAHRAILAQLVRRDAARAKRLMRDHVLEVQVDLTNRVRRRLKQNPAQRRAT